MSESTKNVISRGRLAVKTLYAAAAVLFVAAVVYAGVIALVSATAESSQDRAGIQASIPIAITIAVISLVLAVAAFLISRTAGGTKQRND